MHVTRQCACTNTTSDDECDVVGNSRDTDAVRCRLSGMQGGTQPLTSVAGPEQCSAASVRHGGGGQE